jgi:hypothetical protein
LVIALDYLRAPPDRGPGTWARPGIDTKLPFVYAVWALHRGMNSALHSNCAGAEFRMDTLDHIIRTRTDYDFDFGRII